MPGPRVDTSGQKVTRRKFLKPLAPSGQLKERYRTLEILSLSAVTDLGENRSDLEGGDHDADFQDLRQCFEPVT